ncbi:MAG: UDP-glucose--hexose-1-phosphate uridylyltransferase [Acidobacteria bacterium]|nr:UDP-glucose--hexose-1-phosphate uridylyltransferase [Acidobacteriota bacterium]
MPSICNRPVLDLTEYPHRRLNPLTGEWVLVSPHRTRRPWQGQVEKAETEKAPAYDPSCYLCPGNPRAGKERNPLYERTFVFENDFAALLPQTRREVYALGRSGLVRAEGEAGICRVVCFSPRHDLTLGRMTDQEVLAVVDVWVEQYLDLGNRPQLSHVQIFENRGAMMGASNPHPHGQIWASSSLPNEPAKELASQREYAEKHGACLLCDYLALEIQVGERTILENADFAAVVPFWAVWPFEVLVLSRRHVGGMDQLSPEERLALADILRRLTSLYDRIFNAPFPYSMGFHQRPTDGCAHPCWHLHAHFYPPLLRSSTVRKFMVGFEMLGSPQRDITPESAAARLRETTET